LRLGEEKVVDKIIFGVVEERACGRHFLLFCCSILRKDKGIRDVYIVSIWDMEAVEPVWVPLLTTEGTGRLTVRCPSGVHGVGQPLGRSDQDCLELANEVAGGVDSQGGEDS
jgi:hypothetical protein